MDNERAVKTLNDVIETCRDGQLGFKEAAENVIGTELKEFLEDASQQRAEFARELEQCVRALGGEPETGGSLSGTMRRVWISIRGTLSGKDDRSILSEVERGEDSALNTYEEALNTGLTEPGQTLLERQYRDLLVVHNLVRQMRDARAAKAGYQP